MIRLDRFTKILLTAIALMLAALFFRGTAESGITSEAQAQTGAAPATPTRVDVTLLKELNFNKDIKQVILLGDQKTFLVQVDKGIAVYQVQSSYTSAKR